jgi:hypothetical protein
MTYHDTGISKLTPEEMEIVHAGTAAPALLGRVFFWAGVAQTIEWAGDKAYKAGKAFGRL